MVAPEPFTIGQDSAASGDKVRMELRSPDPSVNPYLAFALILTAGLDGIENNLSLQPPVDADLYTADESVTGKLLPYPAALPGNQACTRQ